ncbi:MAG: GntR family transcriptional regulator [Chitinophagaceae bacterium]
MNELIIKRKSKEPLYLQIAAAIRQQIENGVLDKGAILPSINVFSKQYFVARDTTERAYRMLKEQGWITSVKAIGSFVSGKAKQQELKVLLVFNKLSSFKKIIFYSFLEALGDRATVDLKIHHYSPTLFNEIIQSGLGNYNYYVIMPHFEVSFSKTAYLKTLASIPKHQLVLLDRGIDELQDVKGVFQDFMADIYAALNLLKERFERYKTVVLIFPEFSNHPTEIIEGVKNFCKRYNKAFRIISNGSQIKLAHKQAYIVIEDDDLVSLIKRIRASELVLGKDVGVLSFNETPLKDLLDITVVSTDFKGMGKTAAELLFKPQCIQVKNPFHVYLRSSL